jgi:hypothetical protein
VIGVEVEDRMAPCIVDDEWLASSKDVQDFWVPTEIDGKVPKLFVVGGRNDVAEVCKGANGGSPQVLPGGRTRARGEIRDRRNAATYRGNDAGDGARFAVLGRA